MRNSVSRSGTGRRSGILHVIREGRAAASTFFGDNHPDYAGNVVKAMASAKDGTPERPETARKEACGGPGKPRTGPGRQTGRSSRHCSMMTSAQRVVRVDRLTPTITEVVVRAPKACPPIPARPVLSAPELRNRCLQVRRHRAPDGGSCTDRSLGGEERGHIGLITLEVGASSRMCAFLRPGQHVVVMGPTGTPTEITRTGRCSCSAADWETPCSSPSQKRSKRRITPCHLFRRVQEEGRPLQAGRN